MEKKNFEHKLENDKQSSKIRELVRENNELKMHQNEKDISDVNVESNNIRQLIEENIILR